MIEKGNTSTPDIYIYIHYHSCPQKSQKKKRRRFLFFFVCLFCLFRRQYGKTKPYNQHVRVCDVALVTCYPYFYLLAFSYSTRFSKEAETHYRTLFPLLSFKKRYKYEYIYISIYVFVHASFLL